MQRGWSSCSERFSRAGPRNGPAAGPGDGARARRRPRAALAGTGLQLRVHRSPAVSDVNPAKRLAPDFDIVPMGVGFYKILDDHHTEEEHREAAAKALAFAREKMLSGEYDMLILDEVNNAMSTGLLAITEVMKLLDAKPLDFTVVLTGRAAPEELIERADLVTEMREVKHPYQKGIFAQKGIDF